MEGSPLLAGAGRTPEVMTALLGKLLSLPVSGQIADPQVTLSLRVLCSIPRAAHHSIYSNSRISLIRGHARSGGVRLAPSAVAVLATARSLGHLRSRIGLLDRCRESPRRNFRR